MGTVECLRLLPRRYETQPGVAQCFALHDGGESRSSPSSASSQEREIHVNPTPLARAETYVEQTAGVPPCAPEQW